MPALLESTVRVMTWNVWWQFGPWQERLEVIEDNIRSVNPDLVGLQEVWGNSETNLATQLAERLGYDDVFRFARHRDGVAFGNAVLSRWPISQVDTRDLPGVEGRDEKRLIVCAECDGPRGLLQLFCTHLNYKPQDSAIRQQQVATLAQFVADRRKPQVVPFVCGDFNAVPTSDEIRMMTGEAAVPVEGVVFKDTWREVNGLADGFTWVNENPFAASSLDGNMRIDYVFTGLPLENGLGHIVRSEVCGNKPLDGLWPSDHLAVVADVRY